MIRNWNAITKSTVIHVTAKPCFTSEQASFSWRLWTVWPYWAIFGRHLIDRISDWPNLRGFTKGVCFLCLNRYVQVDRKPFGQSGSYAIFEVLGDKCCYKSSPNIKSLFGLFRNVALFKVKTDVTLLGKFYTKIVPLKFYIRSHCLWLNFFLIFQWLIILLPPPER